LLVPENELDKLSVKIKTKLGGIEEDLKYRDIEELPIVLDKKGCLVELWSEFLEM